MDLSRIRHFHPDLSKFHVFAAGAGAVSHSLELLARSGLGRLTVADPDVVEQSNLVRTAYSIGDISRPKAQALVCRLAAVAPDCRVEAHVSRAETVLDSLAAEPPDVVIAATDSFTAQAAVHRWCLEHRVPVLWTDIHENASGAMHILVLPGQSACYRCIAPSRYALADTAPNELDLSGAQGHGVDVGLVDLVALKLVLAVLSCGTSTAYGRLFESLRDRTQVIVRTDPSYQFGSTSIFDVILADLPTTPKNFAEELRREAFLCCDTLWLRPQRDTACPECAHLSGGI